MSKPFEKWTVLPHGELVQVNDRILTVVGTIKMPIGEFPRRMTLVRLADGGLVVFSAIALDAAGMSQLESFGPPTYMIVPSERHRLDAPSFEARYPAMTIVAPHGSREKVEDVAHVDTTYPDFGDPSVRYVDVPGTSHTEAALEVTAEDGVTLIVNEIIGDIHDAKGLRGWLLKLMGFAGDEPHVPAPVKMQFSKGRAELAGQLRSWAEITNLRRIIVSHGDMIEHEPQNVLRKLADSLD